MDSSTIGCYIVKILSQCNSKFISKEIEKTSQIIPELQELMHTWGELFEKDYDVLKFLLNNYEKKGRVGIKQ